MVRCLFDLVVPGSAVSHTRVYSLVAVCTCVLLCVVWEQKSAYKSQADLEAALWKYFGEFGEVEHLNFVPR